MEPSASRAMPRTPPSQPSFPDPPAVRARAAHPRRAPQAALAFGNPRRCLRLRPTRTLDIAARRGVVRAAVLNHRAHRPVQIQPRLQARHRLHDGALVETVAIVHEAEGSASGRITVCVSSQIGCGMGCTFCATGGMGFQGNLTAGEILEQVWHVERAAPTLGCHWRVSNVVFMGMGEPLNNYRPVLAALHGLVELWAMPPSRITVSTVGVVGRMRTLAADAPPVHHALSLHASTAADAPPPRAERQGVPAARADARSTATSTRRIARCSSSLF